MVHTQYKISSLWKSQLGRRILMVVSGTAGTHALNMAFAPLITRIFGPEAFGLMGTFTGILAIAIPLAALAYPIAIVLPREDNHAIGLVRLSIILSFVVSALTALFVWQYGDLLAVSIGAQSVADFLFLIPLGMLFSAWKQIAEQWLIRKKEFGLIARTTVVHSLILNIVKSGTGWLWPVGIVLIATVTLGHALHAFFLYVGARRRFNDLHKQKNKKSDVSLLDLASSHRDFPMYRTPQNVINAASQSFPILILSSYFGPLAAGYYALATLAMAMPSALLGKAVGDVFYPHITEAAHNGQNLSRQILQTAGALLAIGTIPFGTVVLWGPQIFSFVFGAEWIMAGEYARWLALFFLFNFINQPFVAVVPVLGIQRGLLFYELYSTGSKVLGFVAGYYWFASDLWAIGIFSIVGILAYMGMMFWIYLHAKLWSENEKTGR